MLPDPTPSTIPDVPNKISGSRIAAACEKYSKYATVYFPSSIINGRPAGLSEFPHMVCITHMAICSSLRLKKSLNCETFSNQTRLPWGTIIMKIPMISIVAVV